MSRTPSSTARARSCSPARLPSASSRSRPWPTWTGSPGSAVARLRPRRPIIGLTHHDYSLQHMALEWGVTPVSIPEAPDVEELWTASLEAAVGTGIVEKGDRVVLTAGTAVNNPRSPNVVKGER